MCCTPDNDITKQVYRPVFVPVKLLTIPGNQAPMASPRSGAVLSMPTDFLREVRHSQLPAAHMPKSYFHLS